MKWIATWMAVSMAMINMVAAVEPFRLAVIHSDRKTLDGIVHGNEFDLVADRLGWEKTLFAYSKFPELAAKLSEFDMVAYAPLSFGDGSHFTAHVEELKQFISKGGAVVITDANYPAATSWLEKVDPKLKAYGNGRDSRQWPKQGPILTKPLHGLYCLPNSGLPNEEVTAWGDLELDEKLGWEIGLRSGNGKPSTALNRFGKGIVYVTNQRQGNAASFENIRANLELQRLGLIATSFTMPGLGFDENVRTSLNVGLGETVIGLKSTIGQSGPVALEMEITPTVGDAKKFRVHGTLTDSLELKMPYRVSARGDARVLLQIRTHDGVAAICDRKVKFPPLITVLPPRYRGLLAQDRQTETVDFRVKIARDQEVLAGSKLTLKFQSLAGSEAAPPVETIPTSMEFSVPVKLGQLTPGDYLVKAELRASAGIVGSSEAKFTVLPKTANQVVVDDDLTLLVEGKPFFPIGIYHLNKEDLPVVAGLGFNTMQGWEWGFPHARDLLGAAQAHGMKVILEMGNIRRRHQEIPALIKEFKEHPALLAWYAFDEPQEPDFLFCEDLCDRFRKGDLNHPVFMLSFLPHLFHQHQVLGDIFSVDPYPIPNPVLKQVPDWTLRAREATGDHKPVWLVNQSFGDETPEQLRAMAYLSLVKGARGILWYPWDDGAEQKKGLKYHPHLHAPMKSLIAEIKELTPLLLGKHRQEFTMADAKAHGVFLANEQGRHLIAVNETPETVKGSVEIPGAGSETTLKRASGAGELLLSGGRATIELGPYEVKHYRW